MNWIPLAITAWLAALIVSLIRSRASESEKDILAKYPPGTRLRLFLPGSGNALFKLEDGPALRGLRQRSLLSFAVAALLPLLLIAVLRAIPEGKQALVDEQTASIPGATAEPSLEALADPGGESMEPLPVEGSEPGAAPEGESRTVVGELYVPEPGVPETLEESRAQMRLYGTAKVRPFYGENRQVIGLRIMRVAPGSFWERIGAQNEDVIVEFNGQLVDSPQALVNLMNALSRDKELRLRVRGRKDIERFLEFNAPESP